MSRNSLSTDQELFKGEYLISENGQYKAIFQEDGNFVVYGWSPIWATATNGKNSERLILQGDTNLVIYSPSAAVWATGTYDPKGKPRMRLTLNNQGHLVLTKDGQQIWTSKK